MMPFPVEASYEKRRPNTTAASAILVSAAIGEPYETTLQNLNNTQTFAKYDKSQLWTEQDIVRDAVFIQHAKRFELLDTVQSGATNNKHRPYCEAFKPLAIWRAMSSSYDGDYIHWSDASRHFPSGFLPNVDIHKAIQTMKDVTTVNATSVREKISFSPWAKINIEDVMVEPTTPISAFGIPYCAADCHVDTHLCNSIKSQGPHGYKDMIADPAHFGVQPHMLLANMIIVNSVDNRRLVWDWLSMALAKPHDWCLSAVPEEMALDILLYNRSIPYLNTCPFQRTVVNLSVPFAYKGRGTCWHQTKSVNHFLQDMMDGNFVLMPFRGEGSLDGCALRGSEMVDAPCQFPCGSGYPNIASWQAAFENRPEICRRNDTRELAAMC